MSRSGPLRFRAFFLDLLVTAIVISAVFAALLPYIRAATFKARSIDVLYASSAARDRLIERHAQSGVWTETQAQTSAQETRVSKPNIDFAIDTADGSVIAAGTLSGRAFRVDLRPAVADPVSQWSVRWLCGAQQPPAGWTTANAARFEVVPEPLFSVCRTGKL